MADELILLVDDEEGIRKVLGISLMDSGYRVLTAASGEEALGIFREHNPSIVLTDIKMPGMDGIALLRKIKEERPDTEVIVITGHGDFDFAVKSLQADASDFITKPIHDEALTIALKRAHERVWMKARLREYTEGLERLVQEKTEKLLQAERLAAVGQTVATLAHAIKNIIGGLKGGMYVLEKGMELDNRGYLHEGWQMVKGNVDKIKNLSLDLLNYAKEREPDYRLCDPNAPLQEVFQLVASRGAEHGVEVVLDADPALEELLLDPDAMHCCLLNLASNALDACLDMRCSRKVGRVLLRSCKRDGWGVEYCIEDNGCGMDAETKGKIFRTFFSTKGSKGTGLGLMIAQKIVGEHGGSIEVESEEGSGTCFVVRLPAGARSA